MIKPWRIAASLLTLRSQIDAKFPKRNTASDGAIGDAEHASRDSDHNPWVVDGNGIGVVTAVDVTDESAAGCDAEDLVALIRASRDQRVKYLIFNGRICRSYDKPGIKAWEWAPYTGKNAHAHHFHISVRSEPEYYDSKQPWKINVR